MRILYLAHRLPWPPVKGDKIRSWRWVEALAAAHEVFLGTLAESPEERAAGEEIRARVAELAVFGRPGRGRAVRALVSGRSFSEEVFRSPGLLAWVREAAGRVRPDVAIGFSSTMAQYLDGLSMPRVLDLVDVDSEKWRRYSESRFPRVLWRAEARRLRARELAILGSCRKVTVVSPEEAARLPAAPGVLEVLPNGVDTEYFRPDPEAGADPGSVVFTGAMDYAPNVEAAVWFAREVLPRIRKAGAGARFTIVGSNPAAAVRALAAAPGVVVTGTVPDVRPFLRSAEVAVAPLHIAMGVQNKVLEAMACGVAVVATPGAAEGLSVVAGRDLVVADGAKPFAAAVAGLLADPARRREVGAAARRRVLEGYRWGPVLARMREIAAFAAGKEAR